MVAPDRGARPPRAHPRTSPRDGLLLLGGEGGALLLAFTILAAAALRRDVTDARRRLTWFGASRWQVELHTLVESLALAAAGTVAGWALGAGVAAIVASSGGLSGRRGDRERAAVGGRARRRRGRRRLGGPAALRDRARAGAPTGPARVHAARCSGCCGALAVVLVGWARGSVDAQQLSGGGGTSAFLLLVPALIVFAAAVVSARLLAPALRALGRAGRARADLAAAGCGVTRPQSRPRGDRRDVPRREPRVSPSSPLPTAPRFCVASTTKRPSQCLPHMCSPRISPSSCRCCTALPPRPCPSCRRTVLRCRGTFPRVRRSASSPCRAARCRPCRAGVRTSRRSRSRRSGRRLTPRPAGLQLLALPPGRRFTLPVTATGDEVGVRAFFRSRLGDYVAVSLGHTRPDHRFVLRARIPFRHATLAGLELDIRNNGRLTANAGTGIQPSAQGTLDFGAPRVNGRAVPGGFARFTGTGGVGGSAEQARLRADTGPHGHLPAQAAHGWCGDARPRHPSACAARRPTRDPPARHRG